MKKLGSLCGAIAKLALLASGRRLGTVNPRRVPCEGIELRRVCVL